MPTQTTDSRSFSLLWLSLLAIILGFVLLFLMNSLLQEDLPSPFDKDGDYLINEVEFQHAMVVMFDRLDDDGDGLVSAAELDFVRKNDKLSIGNSISMAFRSMEQDLNADGYLSRRELISKPAAKAFFKGLDKNADGFLERDESDSAVMDFIFPG